jgi:hypothetical protein
MSGRSARELHHFIEHRNDSLLRFCIHKRQTRPLGFTYSSLGYEDDNQQNASDNDGQFHHSRFLYTSVFCRFRVFPLWFFWPEAANDDMPRRIAGWFTQESIANPAVYHWADWARC